MVTPAELEKLDMPDWSLKVTHPVTGEEGYRVGMEVFHHLHCINLLRRVTYKEYYEPLGGEFGHGREALQAHTGESFVPLSIRPYSDLLFQITALRSCDLTFSVPPTSACFHFI